jgi:hypothetical protein
MALKPHISLQQMIAADDRRASRNLICEISNQSFSFRHPRHTPGIFLAALAHFCWTGCFRLCGSLCQLLEVVER